MRVCPILRHENAHDNAFVFSHGIPRIFAANRKNASHAQIIANSNLMQNVPNVAAAPIETRHFICTVFPTPQLKLPKPEVSMPIAKGCVSEKQVDGTGVTAEVERMFETGPYLALRSIRCEISENTLVLTGCVPSFYLKQLAQTQVTLMNSGLRLANRIEVPHRVDGNSDD